jgi:hypothetical protein
MLKADTEVVVAMEKEATEAEEMLKAATEDVVTLKAATEVAEMENLDLSEEEETANSEEDIVAVVMLKVATEVVEMLKVDIEVVEMLKVDIEVEEKYKIVKDAVELENLNLVEAE